MRKRSIGPPGPVGVAITMAIALLFVAFTAIAAPSAKTDTAPASELVANTTVPPSVMQQEADTFTCDLATCTTCVAEMAGNVAVPVDGDLCEKGDDVAYIMDKKDGNDRGHAPGLTLLGAKYTSTWADTAKSRNYTAASRHGDDRATAFTNSGFIMVPA